MRLYKKMEGRTSKRVLYTLPAICSVLCPCFIFQEINNPPRGFLSLYCYFSQIYDTYGLTKCQVDLPHLSLLVWKCFLSSVIGVSLSFVILLWCLREKFGQRSPLQLVEIQRCAQGHLSITDARCYQDLNEAPVLNERYVVVNVPSEYHDPWIFWKRFKALLYLKGTRVPVKR